MNLDDALSDLLPVGLTGDRRADLIAAARQTWLIRQLNTQRGALVIDALHQAGLTYREIEELTGIPKTTAQRWATPPGQGDT